MDIHLHYEESLDQSHHRHLRVVKTVCTGCTGWPLIYIDSDFLQWVYAHQSTSGISQFLHVSWWTVQNALLNYGIAESQDNPFILPGKGLEEELSQDTLCNPNIPKTMNISINTLGPQLLNSTDLRSIGPLLTLRDNALDALILQLRAHFHQAGISMLDRMLQQSGYHLPCHQIMESLMCIDPTHCVFQHIWICHWVYSVPGPNFLWHHDGQHGKVSSLVQVHMQKLTSFGAGLIHCGIVINGYSCLITGLCVSDNNWGESVFDLFHHATQVYGVPSWLRGNHGMENIVVATWMGENWGMQQGSYIWGR